MRAIQIWQYGLPSAAETGLDDAIAMAKQFGFDTLLVKALDGLNWMAEFDAHPDAIGSIGKVTSQCAKAHAAGLRYFVWTNPKHTLDVDAEATLTGQLALACDGVFLDTEPYTQFWGADAPAGLAAHFMDVLRQTAPDAFVVLQPDPRPNALQALKADEWAPKCSAIAGQHYWTDFGSDPRAELAYAASLGQRFSLPVYPTLPGNADPASVPADLVASFPGFVVWRMGSTGPAMLQTLAAIVPATPATPATPAPPARETPDDYPFPDWRQSAIAFRGAMDDLGKQIAAFEQQTSDTSALQSQLAAATAKITKAQEALAA